MWSTSRLIIRAAFLSERANIAIIVAPLRALCNEITMDMYKAFGNDVTINQFSDVLQNDFWNLLSEDIKRQILICTPEKLSYGSGSNKAMKSLVVPIPCYYQFYY